MGNCYCEIAKDGTFCFRSRDGLSHFLFLLSDLSAFGNPAKKPRNIRENYCKANKMLLENPLDEFQLLVKSGDFFKVYPPVLNRKESEPKVLSLTIEIPPGEAVKVYSIDGSYFDYIINEEEKFTITDNYKVVEQKTGGVLF